MTTKNTTQQLIIKQINELTQKYEQLYINDNDIKALQGVERCLEMKIKVLGLDPKINPQNQQQTTDKDENNISITELPTELLDKLLLTIKNMKKQKQ